MTHLLRVPRRDLPSSPIHQGEVGLGLVNEGGSWSLDDSSIKLTVDQVSLVHIMADVRADMWFTSLDDGFKVVEWVPL